MKVMPMHQPHAQLVALGVKKIETRPIKPPTTMRGQVVAVHANKSRDYLYLARTHPFRQHFTAVEDLSFGCIVGTVEIVSYQTITEEFGLRLATDGSDEYDFGDYTPGRCAWLLRNGRRLVKPIPFRAHQGWPDVDDALIAEAAL